MSLLREAWSRATAYWMGWRPSIEKTDKRISKLLFHARHLGLDTAEIRRLLRPRLIFMATGRYGPHQFLLAGRLKDALLTGQTLPEGLHALAMKDDATRRLLLDAADAYAEAVSTRYYHVEEDSTHARPVRMSSTGSSVTRRFFREKTSRSTSASGVSEVRFWGWKKMSPSPVCTERPNAADARATRRDLLDQVSAVHDQRVSRDGVVLGQEDGGRRDFFRSDEATDGHLLR